MGLKTDIVHYSAIESGLLKLCKCSEKLTTQEKAALKMFKADATPNSTIIQEPSQNVDEAGDVESCTSRTLRLAAEQNISKSV